MDLYSFIYFHRLDSKTISWELFMSKHESFVARLTRGMIEPKYLDMNPCVIVNQNGLELPNIRECESMCYIGDKIIRVIGLHEKMYDLKLYVIITSFGTVLEKTANATNVAKMGTIQYSDEIINLIKRIRTDTYIDTYVKILTEIDAIQKDILIWKQIQCIQNKLKI